MTLRYLLDTHIVSYYLRRISPDLEKRLNDILQQHSCAISTVTRAELRYGQTLMDAADSRRVLVDAFLQRLPHLPWTGAAADHFGIIKAANRLHGTPRGDLDTQIAAQALAEGLILVTHNVKHFEGTVGLKIEDWLK